MNTNKLNDDSRKKLVFLAKAEYKTKKRKYDFEPELEKIVDEYKTKIDLLTKKINK